MIVRLSIILLAAAAGAAAASLTPGLSPAVRSTIGALPGMARFQDKAPGEPGQNAGKQPDQRQPAEPGDGEDGLLKLTPERIALARIEVATVRGGQLSRHITVPGTIAPAADRIARVPAKVGGIVAELRKRLNDPVAKGEVVAVLDSREAADARSDYMTASVNLELQKTMFERAKILWDKRISAEQQFLQARATFAEAALRLDLGRQKLLALGLDAEGVAKTAQGASRLRQYEIRSPATGRVVERKVDVGTSVGQLNDPTDLYTIVDLSRVWVELAVSPTDLPVVRQGQQVTVTGVGEGASRAEGEVVFVSPFLDRETRSARVIAEIANPDETWRPGSFVTAEIVLEGPAAAAIVPKGALQTIGGSPAVFVRTPEGFRKQTVTVGRTDDTSVEITAGVQSGDAVAVKNSFALKAELGRSQLAD